MALDLAWAAGIFRGRRRRDDRPAERAAVAALRAREEDYRLAARAFAKLIRDEWPAGMTLAEIAARQPLFLERISEEEQAAVARVERELAPSCAQGRAAAAGDPAVTLAPWWSLTPQAQRAAWKELEALIARTPRPENVSLAEIEAQPEVIPYLIEKLKARLEAAGR